MNLEHPIWFPLFLKQRRNIILLLIHFFSGVVQYGASQIGLSWKVYKNTVKRRIPHFPPVGCEEKLISSDDVKRIMDKWVDMVTKNGIWEHYNPETGRGYGAEGLGMSCLVVDWMARLGIVQVQRTS